MTGPIEQLLRPDLRGRTAYGAPQLQVAVLLNVNESSYAVPSAVVADMAAAVAEVAPSLNRYPDNGMVELTEALAKKLGVTPDNIQTGCGSVSLCQNLITITTTPGDEVLFGWRSFETYPLARCQHRRCVPALPHRGLLVGAQLAHRAPSRREQPHSFSRLIAARLPGDPRFAFDT